MPKDLPSIAFIILNWNNPADTIACVQTLQTAVINAACHDVILVVDNGSTDDSVAQMRAADIDVQIIENQQNLGYAGGNNVGIRAALAQGIDYVCILNNDVIVTPHFLVPLLQTIQADPQIGIVTPLIALASQPDEVWAGGAELNAQTGQVQRLNAGLVTTNLSIIPAYDVQIAPGAAFLVHRSVLEQVGLLDEAYFLYYEEIDWSLRVRQAGFRIVTVPQSVVLHKVSATLGQTSPVTDYYMARNRYYFVARNWYGLARLRLFSRTFLGQTATILAYTFRKRSQARLLRRDVRLLALRDGLLGRWGEMGADVTARCFSGTG